MKHVQELENELNPKITPSRQRSFGTVDWIARTHIIVVILTCIQLYMDDKNDRKTLHR